MVMLFASAIAAYSGRGLADADGHNHDAAATCATYEFGGIYAVPVGGTYKLSAPQVNGAYPEPTLNVVVLPVADAAQATLDAQTAKAVDGMGHTPCTIVEPAGTVVAGEHKCSQLHIEGATPATYTLQSAELTTGFVAVFLQHDPDELSLTLSEAATPTVKISPTVQVPARPCPAAAAAGCTTAYEFGAIFAVDASAGTYTWTAYKKDNAWAAPKMKIVVLPVANGAEATLTAAKAEAVDGMGHTPCTQVEPGETIVPGDHKCSEVHIEGDTVATGDTVASVSYWL